MSNIILVILISVLGFFPSTPKINLWEDFLRDKIDNERVLVEEITVNNIPEKTKDFKEFTLKSGAAYFIDASSGVVLYEKNKDTRLSPASISKLMTALIVISQTDLNEVVTITPQKTRMGDASMNLIVGDRVTVRALLYGLLLNSGSDAALNLASHVSGSEEAFAYKMNDKAKVLGLLNTNFTNPVGWDDKNNYSSAKDLTTLARVALKDKNLQEIFSKSQYTVISENKINYHLRNTNTLLDVPGYRGVKTGTTFIAGECLVIYFNDGEREIIGTVLDSRQRFLETKNLIEWTKNSFLW